MEGFKVIKKVMNKCYKLNLVLIKLHNNKRKSFFNIPALFKLEAKCIIFASECFSKDCFSSLIYSLYHYN